MDPNESFDLNAWVSDQMPALVDAEAAEDWQGSSARPVRRPATELLGEDSPLQSFLRSPDEPPEGTSREERRAFYADRRAAEVAAWEAVEDAQQDHQWMVDARGRIAAANALDGLLAKAHEQVKRAENGERVPVKGPNQPTNDVGRW